MDTIRPYTRGPYKRRDPVARFWSKVERHGDEECWPWLGADQGTGYGEFMAYQAGPGRSVLTTAHRFVYELYNGPVPDGMRLDHICRTKKCVNPAHLRVVTNKQNAENLPIDGRGRSGIRGVNWDVARARWYVQVRHNYRPHYGGSFTSLLEAAEAARLLRNSLFTHNDADR